MAQISYNVTGKYYLPCHNLVGRYLNDLAHGRLIIWHPGWPAAKSSDYLALIVPGTYYITTFASSNPSQSSRKLRQVATALRDHGLFELFHLTDKDGVITIQRTSMPRQQSFGTDILVPNVKQSRDWWDELLNILNRAMATGIPLKKIVFRGGGTIPIPDWFKDWCRENGIDIEILDPDEFDRQYCETPIVVNGIRPIF
jgi:hypothetical protein